MIILPPFWIPVPYFSLPPPLGSSPSALANISQ